MMEIGLETALHYPLTGGQRDAETSAWLSQPHPGLSVWPVLHLTSSPATQLSPPSVSTGRGIKATPTLFASPYYVYICQVTFLFVEDKLLKSKDVCA